MHGSARHVSFTVVLAIQVAALAACERVMRKSRTGHRVLTVLLLSVTIGCTAAPPPVSPAATKSPSPSVQEPTATQPPETSPDASVPGASAPTGTILSTPNATAPATPPGVDVTAPPAADLPSALVFARAKVGSLPSSMAWAGGRLWLADGFGVAELDPATGAITRRLELGPLATLAASPEGEMLMAASYLDETIAAIDPVSGSVVSEADVPCPRALAATSGTEVWVTSPCVNRVTRVTLDAGVQESVNVTRLGTIAVGSGAAWVLGDNSVVRIDGETLEKRQVFPPTHGFPTDLVYVDSAQAAGGLWVSAAVEVFVTSTFRGGLVRVDPETLEAESIDAGSPALLRPLESIESNGDHIWAVGLEPSGPPFEVPRVLTRVNTETKSVVNELVVPVGSNVLAGGAEADAVWLGAPLDEVLGVRAIETTDEPPAATASDAEGLRIETTSYAGTLLDHVYLPADDTDEPTFVLVGGGPVPPSEVHHMSDLATALAAAGSVAHVIGYRSDATGDSMTETLADIRCGVAFARSTVAEYGGGDRVVVVGFSYGGEAVLQAATTEGAANPECAASGAEEPAGVVALDAMTAEVGGTGTDVPFLLVGALGGNLFAVRVFAEEMRAGGYEVEHVEFDVDHGRMIDPSATVGILERIIAFADE